MTHPTPEQVDGAIERLRALVRLEPADCSVFDDWIGDNSPTYGDLALLLSLVERQREALKPFAEEAKYWKNSILGNDYHLTEACDATCGTCGAPNGDLEDVHELVITIGDLMNARAAIGESNDA